MSVTRDNKSGVDETPVVRQSEPKSQPVPWKSLRVIATFCLGLLLAANLIGMYYLDSRRPAIQQDQAEVAKPQTCPDLVNSQVTVELLNKLVEANFVNTRINDLFITASISFQKEFDLQVEILENELRQIRAELQQRRP